jgi:hypothetical protein
MVNHDIFSLLRYTNSHTRMDKFVCVCVYQYFQNTFLTLNFVKLKDHKNISLELNY